MYPRTNCSDTRYGRHTQGPSAQSSKFWHQFFLVELVKLHVLKIHSCVIISWLDKEAFSYRFLWGSGGFSPKTCAPQHLPSRVSFHFDLTPPALWLWPLPWVLQSGICMFLLGLSRGDAGFPQQPRTRESSADPSKQYYGTFPLPPRTVPYLSHTLN